MTRGFFYSYARLWMFSLLSLSWGMVLPGWSAEYIVTPSVELSETYDDNVFFEDVDDLEHRISPTLKLDAQTDRAKWQTSAAWDISEYQRNSELNTVDQAYQISVDAAPGDLWRLNLAGQYVDDYTFRSALEESGILAERSKRKSATVQPGAAFELDPRNTLALTYAFNKTQYEFAGYPDYRLHGLNVSWFHDLLNERTRVICTVGGNQVDFEADSGDITQRTYRALAGLDHRFTETLQFQFTVGARYTESEFPQTEYVFVPPDSIEGTTKTVDEEDTGFIVDGTLNWRTEQIGLSASVNRDVTPSIYGELVTRDRVSAGFTYQWSKKLRGGLSAAYYLSETDGVVQQGERQTYAAQPWMVYRFTEDINLHLGYSYTWTENMITDRSEDRSRIFAQLTVAWPKQMD